MTSVDAWARALDVSNDDDGLAVVRTLSAHVAETSERVVLLLRQRLAEAPGDAPAQLATAAMLLGEVQGELDSAAAGFRRHERG